ncbi:hypothetical protein HanXRQr2_Chr09g0398241 [Helianthus annuus]|nr:hypothetical protein HanXRQr2_Chr09g0398241 [Helianthus annuus]KAJ0893989.1 hypothetical protein HanPSC8_Chr09g0383991 [Helianthus annuus]
MATGPTGDKATTFLRAKVISHENQRGVLNQNHERRKHLTSHSPIIQFNLYIFVIIMLTVGIYNFSVEANNMVMLYDRFWWEEGESDQVFEAGQRCEDLVMPCSISNIGILIGSN